MSKFLTSLLLILILGPASFAEGLKCSDVFVSRPLSRGSEQLLKWSDEFSDLRSRFYHNNKDILSTGVVNLKVTLTSNEKQLFLDSNTRILNQALKKAEPILKELETQEQNKKNAEEYRQEAHSLLAQIQKWSQLDESVTYENIFEFSSKTIAFVSGLDTISILKEYKGNSFILEKIDTYTRLGLFNIPRFDYALRYGLLPIFTDRKFSIRDFNRLLSKRIAPVGMIATTTKADGIKMSPFAFYRHDIDHANIVMAEASRVIYPWSKLLEKVDEWSAEEQAAAHVIIFFITHEKSEMLANTLIEPQSRRKAEGFGVLNMDSLAISLRSDGYFGETKLAEVSDLSGLLQSVSNKLSLASDDLRKTYNIRYIN